MDDLQQKLRPPSDSFSADFTLFKELYPLIVSNRSPLKSTIRDLQCFVNWTKEQGIWNDKLTIKETKSAGVGVFAADRIDLGEVLLDVPQSLMITSIAHGKLRKIVEQDRLLRSMPNLVLILRLVEESLKKSKWTPYINFLPRSFDLPMFYSPGQIAGLKGLSVQHDCLKDIFLSVQQYFYLKNIVQSNNLFDVNQFTFSLFEWARAITLTRQNPIQAFKDDNVVSHLALIPLFDLFNHQPGEITSHFDLETKSVQLCSSTPVDIGQEVTMSYGRRSNQDLFMFSGFVTDTIENDRLRIFVKLSETEPHRSEKELWMKIYGVRTSGYFPLTLDIMDSPSELRAMLCILNMNDKELQAAKETNEISFENLREEMKEKVRYWLKTKAVVQRMQLSKHNFKSNTTVDRLAMHELEFWTALESKLNK